MVLVEEKEVLSLTDENRYGAAGNVLRYAAAGALLSFYVLPGTVWQRISSLQFLNSLHDGVSVVSDILIVSTLFLVISLVYRKFSANKREADLLWWLILAYAGIFTATVVLFNVSPEVGSNCSAVLLSLGCGLLAARICADPIRLARLLTLLGTTQAIYAIYYLTIRHNVMVSGDTIRAGGTFDQPYGVCTVALVCLPIALCLAMEEQRAAWMTLWMACAGVLFAALLVTWLRGGLLATAVGLTWMAYRLMGRRPSVALVGFILCLGFASTMYVRSNGAVNQASADRSMQGRSFLWRRGFEIFRNNWLTGVGAGSLSIPVKMERPGTTTYAISVEPKNQLLHWLGEMGIGGGVLFVLFVIGIGRSLRRVPGTLAVGVAAAWLSILVMGLFDTPVGTAERLYGNMLAGTLLGVTLILASKHSVQDALPNTWLAAEKITQLAMSCK